MARHFLRLKLALLRNALRSGPRRRVSLVLGIVVWAWIAVWSIGLLNAPSLGTAGVPLVFDAFFAGWLLVPLLGLGSDETLDPSRLALLPLRRDALMRGLILASLVGVAPIATAVALLGAVQGTGASLAVSVVAIAVELLLCVVGSRALTTAFSGILRSRRGRDLLVFVIALVAVLPAVASEFIPRLVFKAGHHGLSAATTRGLVWLPSGWAARAILDARHGDTLTALGLLAAVLAVVAVLALLWSWALQRTLTTEETGGGKARRRAGRRSEDLFAGACRLLPRTPVGAVAAKELRYTWRDPRRRAALVTVLFIIGLPAVALTHGRPSPRLVIVAAGAALVFGLQALNQFGTDGAAFWTNVASGRDPAVDFRGKNLASATLGLVVTGAGAVALGALLGGWVYVPATILLAATVVGVALGAANQASVLSPFPLPDAVTNLWAGPGCLTALAGMLAMLVVLALLLPVGVAVVLALNESASRFSLVCLASACYGFALWRIGVGMATRQLRRRELDLLAIVSGTRGA
jgi:ABC-2 type transport system permease protein